MSRNAQLIYDLVCASSQHPTAEDVFWLIKAHNPKISMATVYNNLNKLVAEGNLRRLTVSGADRYDKTTPHEHLLCARCGKIEDLFLSDFGALLQRSVKEEVLSYDLTVKFVCEGCQKASQTAKIV